METRLLFFVSMDKTIELCPANMKQINMFYRLKKMTGNQKKLLELLRKKLKIGEITIEECHEIWQNNPDYLKQYGGRRT